MRLFFFAANVCAAAAVIVATCAQASAAPRMTVAVHDRCVATPWPPSAGAKGFFAPLLAALGPVILPGLFDRGANYVGDRLRLAAGRSQTVIAAQTTGYFQEADLVDGIYRASRDVKCVIVAHGELAKGRSEAELSKIWSDRADLLWDAGVQLKADPAFYYEGVVVFSDDGESFKIRTVHLNYARSLRSGKSKATDRELAISFVFERGDGQPAAEGAIPLGAVVAGETLDHVALGIPDLAGVSEATFDQHAAAQFETNWMPSLRAGEASLRRLADYCDAGGGCPRLETADACKLTEEGERCDEERAMRAAPFSLNVQVTETPEPSAILTFLANTIEVAQPMATPFLTSRVLGRDVYDPTDPAVFQRRADAVAACTAWREASRAYRESVTAGVAKARRLDEVGEAFSLARDAEILGLQATMNDKLRALQSSFAASGESTSGLGVSASLACNFGLLR